MDFTPSFTCEFEPLKEMSLAQKWQAMQNPELKQRLLTETDPNEVGMSMVFKNEDLLWAAGLSHGHAAQLRAATGGKYRQHRKARGQIPARGGD